MESKIDSLKMVCDAAKHDYHSRNDEHNIKLLDESYDFGWNETTCAATEQAHS